MVCFFDIPDKILILAFGSFSRVDSLCRLDSACCNFAKRQTLLSIMSHKSFYSTQTKVHHHVDNILIACMPWLFAKGIKMKKIVFVNIFWSFPSSLFAGESCKLYCENLEAFELYNNPGPMRLHSKDIISRILIDFINLCRNVKEIKFNLTRFDLDEVFSEINSSILNQIISLDLSNCAITTCVMKVVVHTCRSLKSIIITDFPDSSLISQILKENINTLTSINLRNCIISIEIVEIIKLSTILTDIHIDDSGKTHKTDLLTVGDIVGLSTQLSDILTLFLRIGNMCIYFDRAESSRHLCHFSNFKFIEIQELLIRMTDFDEIVFSEMSALSDLDVIVILHNNPKVYSCSFNNCDSSFCETRLTKFVTSWPCLVAMALSECSHLAGDQIERICTKNKKLQALIFFDVLLSYSNILSLVQKCSCLVMLCVDKCQLVAKDNEEFLEVAALLRMFKKSLFVSDNVDDAFEGLFHPLLT
jgi:hypothetical protein